MMKRVFSLLLSVFLVSCGGQVTYYMYDRISPEAAEVFRGAEAEIESVSCDFIHESDEQDGSIIFADWNKCRDGAFDHGNGIALIPNGDCQCPYGSAIKIAIHEILHALGFDHDDEPGSVMNEQISEGSKITDKISIKLKLDYC